METSQGNIVGTRSTTYELARPHPNLTADGKPHGEPNDSVPDPQDQPLAASIAIMLWDEVYETLRMENPGLVSYFQEFLSFRSGRTVRGPWLRAPLSKFDRNYLTGLDLYWARRPPVRNILDLCLDGEVETTRRDSSASDEVASSELGTLLRAILRDGITSTPADTIPVWAAACLAAETVLLYTTEETKRQCDSLLYIISRIGWYCHLPRMIQGEAADGEDNSQQSQPKLREAIASLYKAVLSSLMAIVCIRILDTYDRNSRISLSEAHGIHHRGIDTVKTAERDLPLFNRDRVRDRLGGVPLSISQPQHINEGLEDEGLFSVNLRKKILENLDVTDPDPYDSLPQLRKFDRKALSYGPYYELLSTMQYQTFRDWSKTDGADRLLCISGGPGSGKTSLLTSVVWALLADSGLDIELQDPSQVSFFFFNHNQPQGNHPTAALYSLVRQIVQAQPRLARHLAHQFISTGRDSLHHPGDFLAVSAVFYNIVEDDELEETFLVVDALDQCFANTTDSNQPGIEEFLFLIARSLDLSDKVRWLVSFDSDSDGEATLRKALVGGKEEKTCHLQIDLDNSFLDSYMNQACYIGASVREIAKQRNYDHDLERFIVRKLLKHTFRNYLWVDTVCAVLPVHEAWHVPGVIEDIEELTSLPDLYAYIHINLGHLPHGDGKLCIQVISTMALLHEPIRVDELHYILELGKWVDVRNILRKCSAFLCDIDGQVWFLHPFAKTYIQRRIIYCSDASRDHKNFFQQCLDYLGNKLADSTGATTARSSYSLLHWLTHLDQISDPSQDGDVQDEIYHFLANYFLPWVEQLIICGQLSAAGVKLHKIHSRLQRAVGPTPRVQTNGNESQGVTLQTMIHDALVFIYLHQATQTPDVPVHSTLAFCSDRSLIRKLWIGKTLPSVSSLGPISRYWGSDTRVFRGHTDWIRTVAFSSDGRLLASGSDDKTVRIWNTETGETQHKLMVENFWIFSVAFSSQQGALKDPMLAVGSETSVTIWDANRGQLLNKLKYTVRIQSVAFSPNARMLAVAASSTVYILDIRKHLGNTKLTNAGINLPFEEIHHDKPVRSVAFSPDGRFLVTGADDAKIRVWGMESICNEEQSRKNIDQIRGDTSDVKGGLDSVEDFGTGNPRSVLSDIKKAKDESDPTVEPKHTSAPKPLHTFEGHRDNINCVVFSADSTLIASCSEDGTSRIWHLGSEKREGVRVFGESGGAAVTSVSFLPSKAGSFLASGTSDCIELWDVETGHKMGSAMSQVSWNIFSPVFSPDGTSIATGSTDNAVHIWYGTAWESESRQIPEEHSRIPRSVGEMALSPDKQTVATSHLRGGVKLWDIKTNKIITEIDTRHSHHLMTFSPRGSMLLASSIDAIICVYKIPSGDALHEFPDHGEWVGCVTWSHDERHVASGSEDGTARIWKIGDNAREVARLIHSRWASVTGVAFSPDGERLVTSGQDKRVLVWQKEVPHGNDSDGSGWRLGLAIEVDNIPLSLSISLDSKRVILYTDGILKAFAIETGEESIVSLAMKFIGKSAGCMAMWFDARFESYVMTLQGAQSLDADVSDRVPRKYPYSIMHSENGLYITYNGKKSLFLSNALGIKRSLVAENYIVLGMHDGGVQIFSFDDSTASLIS
ncbi:WD40 repeat-like protein [Nemania sp. FL0031]|nr:WD40 repeat-like protein [Nemania sp. FL0031]